MITAPLPVAILWDDASHAHDVPGHPESAIRLRAIGDHLLADPALRSLPALRVREADPAIVLGAHDDAHLQRIERAARGGGCWITPRHRLHRPLLRGFAARRRGGGRGRRRRAAECAAGRTVWVLEGGYEPVALSASVGATLQALAEGGGEGEEASER